MIPAFEDSGFLPPFLESATATEGRSPYATTVREIVERFGRTRPRRALLRGFLNYRRHLWEFGVHDGIQWIDGSFVENSESSRGRDPSDIDVVTFTPLTAIRPTRTQALEAIRANAQLFARPSVLARYGCDAYMVNTALPPEKLIVAAAYWANLFGHVRDSREWKGMVQLDMSDGNGAAEYQEVIDGLAR